MPGKDKVTTKKEIVRRISKKLGVKQYIAKDVVQAFLDEVIDELATGNTLQFREFGVFYTVVRSARKARNPKTGAEVQIPAKTVVHFKVGRLMKQKVLALSPDRE